MPSPKRASRKLAKMSSAEQLAKILDKQFLDNVSEAGKPIINKDIIKAFCLLAAEGRPLAWICDLLGLWQPTVGTWVKKGEAYMATEESERNEKHAIYYHFVANVRKAAKVYLMGIQDKQASYPAGEWQKFAWILERMEPKVFGRKDQNGQLNESYTPDDRFL